eukprot:TRINITY_DN2460_c0_g1_i1.p1 TRINITY_DN2460_c0_g1~~TRINITY_DN2460_c0_g1_i1.p1  ORF type:complete len:191 (-),score=30.31 TRINITY_DN2460_c0_g1_i1:226-798(-)
MSLEDYDTILEKAENFETLADSYWGDSDVSEAFVDANYMMGAYDRCMQTSKEESKDLDCAKLATYAVIFAGRKLCPEKVEALVSCAKQSDNAPMDKCKDELEQVVQQVSSVFQSEPKEKLSQPEMQKLSNCLKSTEKKGKLLFCGLEFYPAQKQSLDDCLKKTGISDCKNEINSALKAIGPVLRKGCVEI